MNDVDYAHLQTTGLDFLGEVHIEALTMMIPRVSNMSAPAPTRPPLSQLSSRTTDCATLNAIKPVRGALKGTAR